MSADDVRAAERDWLLALLKVRGRHEDKVREILDYFAPEVITDVAVRNARCPVETIEEYGLVIKLDAYGDAAEVHFPYGAEEVNE